jgi:hypothetical protein
MRSSSSRPQLTPDHLTPLCVCVCACAQVRICVAGKYHHLGYYDNEREAACAYDG